MKNYIVLAIVLLLVHNIAFSQNFTVSAPQKQRQEKSKSAIKILLAAEKNGERVFYTTKEWEKLSLKEKCVIDKIGMVVGEGKDAFLLSLYNNMSRGVCSKRVSYQDALNATGGQLPTKTQLQIINKNKKTISSASQLFGGEHICGSYFWGKNGTYQYIGDNKETFENKAMFRICTSDIENGFHEVFVEKADNEEYDYIGSGPSWKGHNCLQIVGLRNKFGLIDTTGRVIIPIKYDNIDGGSPSEKYSNSWSGNGLISVCINSKWGYIDRNGDIVVPIIYDKVDNRCYVPSDNLHPGITRVLKEGLVGGINHTGTFVLPIEYQEIENKYGKDLFFVKKDNMYGFLNKECKLVIPFKYDFTSGFNKNEELCAVGINEKYGYIDRTGNEVIPLSYDFAAPFYNGLAAVVKNNKLGYINQSGELVIPLKYEVEYTSYQYDNLSKKSRKNLSFEFNFKYSPHIAFVKSSNGKLGIINRKGDLIVDYKYDDIRSASSEAEFTCSIGSNLIYIDAAGNEYQTKKERSEKSTEKMANQGYVDAQVNWGRQYLGKKQYELAYEWLLKAVEQGSVDAIRVIAQSYENRGKYQLAYEWFLKAVESGDIESLREIGDLFYYKKGLKVSYSKATEWYLKYIESSEILEHNNNSQCFYKLGYMHYHGGYGIEQSYTKALYYFEKSSMYDAKYYIGLMYEYGRGVLKNYKKAIEYYKACKGKSDSMRRIQYLEERIK